MLDSCNITHRVNSSAFFQFPFRSIAVRFNWTGKEREWNRTGTGMEQEWNRTGKGMEREWNGNGMGMELEWSGNGTDREWNRNGTKIQWTDNECSVQGTWPVIRLYTSWEPLIELPLSVLWNFVLFPFHSIPAPFQFHSRSVPVPFPLHSRSSSVLFPFLSCSISVLFVINFHLNSVQLNRTAMERNGNWKEQMSWPYVLN